MKVQLSQSSFKRSHANLIIINDEHRTVPLAKHLDGFGTDITADVFQFRGLTAGAFIGEYLGADASRPGVHLLEPGHRSVSGVDLAELYDLQAGSGVLVRYSAHHQGLHLLSDWVLFRL
jgi:hypothetical protein